VRPRENGSEFRWTERILLPEALLAILPAALQPAFARLAYAVIAPVARAGLGYSLIRFARLFASHRP
jgi:hypothetical protein